MLQHKHADSASRSLSGWRPDHAGDSRGGPQAAVEMSNEMKDLNKRARDRRLLPEEYHGGVSAISNLGHIRRPRLRRSDQPAAILYPCRRRRRTATGRTQGKVKIAIMMTVTLSVDHRAIDGVTGAELLKAFRH